MAGDEGLFLGLISGTSADGVDAALVAFDDAYGHTRATLHFGRTYPWPVALRTQLVALGQQAAMLRLDDIGMLDVAIGEHFAATALQALHDAGVAPRAVRAIGSHGQTLRHGPWQQPPFTLQLGDAHVIAERTGITTIADFRRRDVAAGGHGAPLLPALHAALLHTAEEDRAVLNLGGIANLTLLPADGAVRGFDTGPANGLMDAWCLRHTGCDYDADGVFAARGEVDADLLARLLAEPWFALPAPKSTGRDQFHLGWVEAALAGHERAADVQATLLALSAHTVAAALHAAQPGTRRVIACGGGVHNTPLMAALAAALRTHIGADIVLDASSAHGLDPDLVEAMGFAWLARAHLRGVPGNLPTVTGARGARVLGACYPASPLP